MMLSGSVNTQQLSSAVRRVINNAFRGVLCSYEQASGLGSVVAARETLNQRRQKLELAREQVISAAEEARRHREVGSLAQR
jgi:hypothetical protein